jgi:hypothetical protein
VKPRRQKNGRRKGVMKESKGEGEAKQGKQEERQRRPR